MLFHASRSRYIDPGRPPAADGGLRSQYIQTSCLALSSRSTAGAAAAGWAKSIDPLLRHEVEGVHRLGSLGYQTGPSASEPQLTTSARATFTKWVMSTHHENVTM